MTRRQDRRTGCAAHVVIVQRILGRLVIGVLVLGLFAIFLINTGGWGRLIEGVTVTAGEDTAQKVDDFGKTSKQVGDAAGDALTDAKEAAESGTITAPDIAALEKMLDAIKLTAEGQRIPEYRRARFGEPWADVDGNSCDTRNDILTRDLTAATFDDRCRVLTGTLDDPYTGKRIAFVRGEKTSAAVQIDHIVPLAWAWENGAWAWDDRTREAFANDPSNLQSTDGPTNTSKGAKGPSLWTPPNDAYGCEYVTRFTLVAGKYGLTIRESDRVAIERQLTACR